jgi:hypothetical protein
MAVNENNIEYSARGDFPPLLPQHTLLRGKIIPVQPVETLRVA